MTISHVEVNDFDLFSRPLLKCCVIIKSGLREKYRAVL